MLILFYCSFSGQHEENRKRCHLQITQIDPDDKEKNSSK